MLAQGIILPIRTDRPHLRPPVLTVLLIAVNVLVYACGMAMPPPEGAVAGSDLVARLVPA